MSWYKDQIELTPVANRCMIDMQQQEVDVYYITLTLTEIQSMDAGIYKLLVVNQFGEVTIEVSLIVNGM